MAMNRISFGSGSVNPGLQPGRDRSTGAKGSSPTAPVERDERDLEMRRLASVLRTISEGDLSANRMRQAAAVALGAHLTWRKTKGL